MTLSPELQALFFIVLMISIGLGLLLMGLDTFFDQLFGFIERMFFGTIFLAGSIFFLGFAGYIVINLLTYKPQF